MTAVETLPNGRTIAPDPHNDTDAHQLIDLREAGYRRQLLAYACGHPDGTWLVFHRGDVRDAADRAAAEAELRRIGGAP